TTTVIHTLSLHDALPISFRQDLVNIDEPPSAELRAIAQIQILGQRLVGPVPRVADGFRAPDPSGPVEADETALPATSDLLDRERSEEHTSELQSQSNLVC